MTDQVIFHVTDQVIDQVIVNAAEVIGLIGDGLIEVDEIGCDGVPGLDFCVGIHRDGKEPAKLPVASFGDVAGDGDDGANGLAIPVNSYLARQFQR